MVEHSYLLKIFVNNLWKFFMSLIFVGQGHPRKLFNLEHFPIYGILENLAHKDLVGVNLMIHLALLVILMASL